MNFKAKRQTADIIPEIEDVIMNLMICDDQKSELENMRQIVAEYALTHSELSLVVKCFSNPFDMLEEMGKYSFDSIIKVNIYDDLMINFSEIADMLNI